MVMSSTFADYFSSVANSYRRYRPSYPPALFTFLAEQAPQRKVALDIGAGNGQAAAGLAHFFEQVVAIDPSEEQIANALPTAGVQFHVARAENTGCRDACADVITVGQALHWFDQEAFFAEADRLLVPGGLLAIFTYGGLHINEPIDALIETFYKDVVGAYWPDERAQVEAKYSEAALPFEPVDTPPFRMRTKWTLDELLGYLETWSSSRRFREAQGHFATDAIREELTALWGDEVRRVVHWELTVFVRRKPQRPLQ